MAYDVFLVSALEDREMAKLVARRLRALKFKVWLDQKQTDDTFDPKDSRNAFNSQSMLVLWSENAVQSDWVRAAASIGHSRPGMLVETALDKVKPYDPFTGNKRFDLDGFTSRTTVEGFYQTVEELGRRDGRTNLRKWMDYGSKDEALKKQWLADHPTDPLALAAKAKRDKELGIKPAPAAAAAGAAILAATTLKGGNGNGASAATATFDNEDMGAGGWVIPAIMALIGVMLLFGYLNKTEPLRGPAIANAIPATSMAHACPAGQMPAGLLKTLEPGPIVNDTED
ncbi:MAG: toll/interleukin-1 receptor domain-containing protein [Hyphomonadaceae bacterium]